MLRGREKRFIEDKLPTFIMGGTPVNKASEDERTLNFWEKLYLPEIFRGLGFSANKMSEQKMTMNYPEEQFYPPDSYRGRPVLVEENDEPRCVACGLCARSCPPLAISMQAGESENEAKERTPEWFEINMLRCIYCGYCEEVCPEEAIVMSKEYDMTFHDREEAIFDLSELLIPKERLTDRLDYLESYKNPQFGQQWDFPEENNIHSVRDRNYLMWLADEGLEQVDRLEEEAVGGNGHQEVSEVTDEAP
jgi:NADH-quinone oxidoreductase subunit I